MQDELPILRPRQPRADGPLTWLLGRIVMVPDTVQVPQSYCHMFKSTNDCRWGVVVEELGEHGGVAVQFFGYQIPWDYSRNEALQFQVNDDEAGPYERACVVKSATGNEVDPMSLV